MASEKIINIVEEIKGLTILELNELVHAVEEEFGVSAAAPVAAAGAAAGAAAPVVEEKTEFDVVLVEVANRLPVIKAIREALGLGLGEAKAMIDGLPKVLKEGISKDEAEKLKTLVSEAGATVEIK